MVEFLALFLLGAVIAGLYHCFVNTPAAHPADRARASSVTR